MKITTHQYAKSLYEATVEKPKHEIDGVAAKFIKLLQKNRKMKLADKIVAKFAEIWNKEKGIVEVEAITRYKIQDTMIKQVEEFIKNKYQAKQVILNNKIDSSIKGGIVVKVGDEIMDASVARQLGELKKSLAK